MVKGSGCHWKPCMWRNFHNQHQSQNVSIWEWLCGKYLMGKQKKWTQTCTSVALPGGKLCVTHEESFEWESSVNTAYVWLWNLQGQSTSNLNVFFIQLVSFGYKNKLLDFILLSAVVHDKGGHCSFSTNFEGFAYSGTRKKYRTGIDLSLENMWVWVILMADFQQVHAPICGNSLPVSLSHANCSTEICCEVGSRDRHKMVKKEADSNSFSWQCC